MSSPIALRISQLKPIVRSFPRSPLSEPTQISEAWVSILDRTLASDAASISSQANSSQATLAALREAGQQQRLVQFKTSVERLKAGNAMRDYPLSKSLLTPPNDELFYTRARNAIHNAEQGIRRPWWKVFFNVKGAE
ncbi:hypothetical protein D1P53_000737 [Cryptococcus gattii VGV]|uniref:Uncharacterized protein n=1 Tax=Cryptococcus tetragattii IND107 TaxID=1296105 RepID=A0ABR3BLW7_9TREE|nr:hypothetical protein D1P53_000737 [Cryptococcus gattii VGV]KIR83162.1 hypothetical protein I308_06502 [Cryptococcus tetragattii IND107]